MAESAITVADIVNTRDLDTRLIAAGGHALSGCGVPRDDQRTLPRSYRHGPISWTMGARMGVPT